MNGNVYKKIVTAVVFLILLVPLFNLPPYFSPPDWGKSMAFRALFFLAASALLLSGIVQGKVDTAVFEKLKKARLYLGMLGLLFAAFFLSSLFAKDPNFAFWGNPLRGGGFVNFGLLILFGVFLYLFLNERMWKKAWITTIAAAVLVSFIGIIQWQGWFSNVFVEKLSRPMSTLGNDIQLGMYLLLLLFPALGFLFASQSKRTKILFAALSLLFVFVIGLTGSRGSYIGLGLGLFFFVTMFPFKKLWHSLAAKLIFLLLMLLPLGLLYYVNVNSENINRLSLAYPRLAPYVDRFNLAQIVQEPRFSTWQVGWKAIQEKPLLGWGMEHFPVAFDKHYDPQLPNIQYLAGSSNSWWDRAHNIVVDLGVQGGFLGLLAYFLFLGTLFWKLQQIKNKGQEKTREAHGVQAAFLAYLAAALFGFDSFSTYIIVFFLAAYSMFLITRSQEAMPQETASPIPLPGYAKAGAVVLLLLLAVGAWQYTIRPFQINGRIAAGLELGNRNNCTGAAFQMEEALKKGSTFLDGYLRARYFDVLRDCPEVGSLTSLQIGQRAYDLMRGATHAWPYHTRNWIFLGQLANILVERASQAGTLTEEDRTFLVNDSHASFKRAAELSPLHQEIFIEWTKTYIVAKDFEGAKAKAQECVEVDPRTGDCWWLKGLAEEYLLEKQAAKTDMAIAKSKGFNANTFYALSQLTKAYTQTQQLAELAQTYEELIQIRPSESQLHATLAAVYRELGQYAKARETALKVLELNPDTKETVEEFLKTLP